jgi:hypothetical protein
VPVWTAPSGHILWHGSPLRALEAAQRAAEAGLQRAVEQYAAQRAAEWQARPRPKAS